MIFVELPGMVCALLPIIIVEAVIIHRVLALSYRDSFKGISIANLASTLAGVPAAWFIMLAFQFIVTIPLGLAAQHHMVDSPAVAVICYLSSIAWVPPAGDHAHWMIPAASALLLIPCFVVSLLIERFICIRTWRSIEVDAVKRGVLYANTASYVLLFLIACGWFGYEFSKK